MAIVGVGNKVNQVINSVQGSTKNTTQLIFLFGLKAITTFFISLTLAMIAQEVLGFGVISFLFVMIVVSVILMKIMMAWTAGKVFVFQIICVLIGLLLRFYVLVAP